MILLASLSLIGSVSSSSLGDNVISATEAISIIEANNHRHLQLDTQQPLLSEDYVCIAPLEIQQIHQGNDDRLPWGNGDSGAIQKECYLRENSCGGDTAPSACCRVSFEAGWLVCDAYNAFDFMPCVCNDNTNNGPTNEPTPRPTPQPTTGAPTKTPTFAPTPIPTTAAPTKTPTFAPTGTPTAAPTFSPTTPPTLRPTPVPTPMPTPNPTPDPTNAPTSAPTITPMPTEFPTVPLVFTTEDKFDADIGSNIRVSQCRAEPPSLEFVQATTFRYSYEVTDVGGNGVPLGTVWKEGFHDEMASEFLICDGYNKDTVWMLQTLEHTVDSSVSGCSGEDSNDSAACWPIVAEARIVAFKAPTSTTKQLGESPYEEGEVSDKFAVDALNFLQDRLSSGDAFGLSSAFSISYVGGEIVPAEVESETKEPSEDLTGGDVWEDNDNNAIGIEEGSQNSNIGRKRFTPTMIGTIVGVLACLVLIAVLGVVVRRRRNPMVRRGDEEFLQDVNTPRSDTWRPVEHLDLSDSGSDSSEPDVEESGNVLSAGPLRSTPKSPMHFKFSGFQGKPKSPTARQRNKMGPLGGADEFREETVVFDDSGVGTHRGGIQATSSSDYPPAPHQNSSPRVFQQVRDTMNL